jgi:hypothetical protein
MSTSGSASLGSDLRTIGGEGFGTYLYGTDRHALLQVAYALARLMDPSPYWVDIQATPHDDDPEDPVGMGWIPRDHLFTVVETDSRPLNAEANMALWTFVRSDEPPSTVAEFTDFLRLPRTVQHGISGSRSDVGRPVFVIANADRARPYYPSTAGEVRPYIDSMLHAGIVPIFVAVGPPGAGRWAFDFVFEVRTHQVPDWRRGSLVCERAPPGLPIVSGQVRPLDAVPGIAR